MLKWILLFITFILQGFALANESVQNYDIDLGMSSSYHSAHTAPILNYDGKKFDQEYLLRPDIINKRHSSSTLERFLSAREEISELDSKVTTNKSDILKMFKNIYFNPQADRWEGLCDRWSAAAIDRDAITSLRHFPKGAVCGTEAFSHGELKELTSFLYPLETGDAESEVGDRTKAGYADDENSDLADSDLPDFSINIRNSLGLDDIKAHELETLTIERLSSKQGLIYEMSPESTVWNYPVVGATVKKTPMELHETLQVIPLDWLKVTAPEYKDILEFLQKSDHLMTPFIGPFQTPIQKKLAEQSWMQVHLRLKEELADILEKNGLFRRIDWGSGCNSREPSPYGVLQCLRMGSMSYLTARAKILSSLEGLTALSPIGPLGISRHELTVRFYRPGQWWKSLFGFNYDMQNDTMDERTFSYYVFKTETGKVFSRWISDADSRPDIAWVPVKAPEVKISENEKLTDEKIQFALYEDLQKMLTKCIGIDEMEEYTQKFHSLSGSGPEMRRLKEQYKRLLPYLQPQYQ